MLRDHTHTVTPSSSQPPVSRETPACDCLPRVERIIADHQRAHIERAIAARPGDVTPVVLSDRELQVVAALAGGLSTHAVAAVLYLSQATVKTHAMRIHRKLGVRNRAELVAWAVRNGVG